MSEVSLKDIRVAQSVFVSRSEYDAMPDRFKSSCEQELRMALAHFIQRERSTLIVRDDFVEKRLELYVATPEQFWRLVRIEADKVALLMGHPR